MSKEKKFEEGLQEYLQEAVDVYLDGKDGFVVFFEETMTYEI